MTRTVLLCVLLCAAVAGCRGGSPSSPSGLLARVPLTMTFTPENQTFADATEEYRRIWTEEGSRIADALERETTLNFFQGNIAAVVYEGISSAGNRDTPMRLRASYPLETKRSALVHELGHRLISQLLIRPSDLDEHRVLNLFLYDVWESLWGKEFADRQVEVEGALRGVYDYESAWRFATSLSKAERAARFAAIVQSNRR